MAEKGLQIGVQAPDFSLAATTGGRIKLADFKNKPLIIVFLRGTW